MLGGGGRVKQRWDTVVGRRGPQGPGAGNQRPLLVFREQWQLLLEPVRSKGRPGKLLSSVKRDVGKGYSNSVILDWMTGELPPLVGEK